jgi:hypothetical protein
VRSGHGRNAGTSPPSGGASWASNATTSLTSPIGLRRSQSRSAAGLGAGAGSAQERASWPAHTSRTADRQSGTGELDADEEVLAAGGRSRTVENELFWFNPNVAHQRCCS